MNKEKQTKAKTSYIHLESKNIYEVANSVNEIRDLMFDDFIQGNTFLQLRFPDGTDLFVKKKDIESFYESE